MDETIGQKIRRLREARGITQEELAEGSGIPRSSLSKIETNKQSIKHTELTTLADLLHVTPDTLLSKIPLPEVYLEPSQQAPLNPAFRINVPARHVEKFKEVLLYVLSKIGAKPNIGETVLYKLLYFIDFDYYERYEEQLIGATYIKNKFGPTPSEFSAIVDAMIKEGILEKVTSSYFKHEQKKYLPHRPPHLKALTAQEVKLIDEVLDRLSDMSATAISEYSHGDVPWVVTADKHPIEYESVFYRTQAYSVRKNEGL